MAAGGDALENCRKILQIGHKISQFREQSQNNICYYNE